MRPQQRRAQQNGGCGGNEPNERRRLQRAEELEVVEAAGLEDELDHSCSAPGPGYRTGWVRGSVHATAASSSPQRRWWGLGRDVQSSFTVRDGQG